MRRTPRSAAWMGALALWALLQPFALLAAPPEGEPPRRPEGDLLVFRRGPLMLFHRGYLGVHLLDLTPELRAHFGVPEGEGVMVSKVEAESPAALAGLLVGDIITRIDSQSVDSSWEAVRRVGETEGGQTVSLEARREGRVLTLEATLEERERQPVVLRGLHRLPKGGPVVLEVPEGGRLRGLELRREPLDAAVAELERALESGELRERVLDCRDHSLELERRMEELERRLLELQGRLEVGPP